MLKRLIVGLAACCSAIGAGLYEDPCGDIHPFLGGSSAVIFCVVPGGGESNSAGTGIAGQNFFENHLSPVRDLGTIDGKTVTFFHEVTTSPTWDATVTEVPTHLGLVDCRRVTITTRVGSLGCALYC